VGSAGRDSSGRGNRPGCAWAAASVSECAAVLTSAAVVAMAARIFNDPSFNVAPPADMKLVSYLDLNASLSIERSGKGDDLKSRRREFGCQTSQFRRSFVRIKYPEPDHAERVRNSLVGWRGFGKERQELKIRIDDNSAHEVIHHGAQGISGEHRR